MFLNWTLRMADKLEGMTLDDLEVSSLTCAHDFMQLADMFELIMILFSTLENWCSRLGLIVNAKIMKWLYLGK